MNLNLAANSVGFYQLSKLACIPVTLLMEKVCYNRIPSLTVLLTLLPLLAGVGMGTVNDVTINFIGTMYALFAVVAAPVAQILTSNVQKEMECGAMQLLHRTSPLIVVQIAMATPIFHDVGMIVENRPSWFITGHILLSCALAFGVNVSNYMVLGLTSPVTYQVMGHLKTTLILVIGCITFKTLPTPSTAFGMFLAVFGGKDACNGGGEMVVFFQTTQHSPTRTHTLSYTFPLFLSPQSLLTQR